MEAKGHKVAVVVLGKRDSQREAEPQPGAIEKALQEIVVALHGVQITQDNPSAGLGNTQQRKVARSKPLSILDLQLV